MGNPIITAGGSTAFIQLSHSEDWYDISNSDWSGMSWDTLEEGTGIDHDIPGNAIKIVTAGRYFVTCGGVLRAEGGTDEQEFSGIRFRVNDIVVASPRQLIELRLSNLNPEAIYFAAILDGLLVDDLVTSQINYQDASVRCWSQDSRNRFEATRID